MKVLQTEQQNDLQKFLQNVSDNNYLPIDLRPVVNYWAIELKPKRKKKVPQVDVLVQNALDVAVQSV